MALPKAWDLSQDVAAGIGDQELWNVPADPDSVDPYFVVEELDDVLDDVLKVDVERMLRLLIESWPDFATCPSVSVGLPNVTTFPVVPLMPASFVMREEGSDLLREHGPTPWIGPARLSPQPSATLRADLVERCLHDLDEDALQQEIEIDSEVRGEVERILFSLRSLPDDVSVVAEDGGCAEIEVFNAPHGGFVLRCEPGRTAVCVVSVEQFSRRARYQDSTMLPDHFVEDGLRSVLQNG